MSYFNKDQRDKPNDAKMKELILLIAQRSLADPRFGATKLNKLLFFVDFGAYVQLGKPITSHSYQKLGNGPAPRQMLTIVSEMVQAGDLAQAKHQYFGREQIRSVALRDPDLGLFSAAEIALVTELIADFWEFNATQMSQLSHEFDGWKLARDGETIPYEVALVRLADETPIDKAIDDDLRDALAKSA